MLRIPGLFLLVVFLVPMSAVSADLSKAAGRKSCVSCHAAEDRTIAASAHESDRSCEQCHGSGEQHLRKPERGTMFSFSRASAEEVKARCRECHRNQIMDNQAKGDVSCISCHSIHHYVSKKHLLKPGDNPLDNTAKLHRNRASSQD
jgi:ribosomal protein S27E